MSLLALLATVCVAVPAPAATSAEASQAVGVDLFSSSDADDTEVQRYGVNLDWRYATPASYEGLRIERAVFRPVGRAGEKDLRVYYRFAEAGRDWAWNGQVGTDGETILGAVAIHSETRYRPEFFLEREVVETPQGLQRGVYYTFAGGALDLPIDDRNNATVVAAVQDFTGRNLRTHLRLNYVHTLQPRWGLTAQLRTRYFHSTHPGEFDYFSPRNFVQVTPTLQLRRRDGGWRYVVAAGLGAQRQTGGRWRQARALSAQVTSPPAASGWSFEGAFAYSNTPVGAGNTYDYRQLTLGLRRAF